jgi:hypothetical protein
MNLHFNRNDNYLSNTRNEDSNFLNSEGPQNHSAAERIKSKNQITSSAIEPATFQIISYFFNQLRYRVPLHAKL